MAFPGLTVLRPWLPGGSSTGQPGAEGPSTGTREASSPTRAPFSLTSRCPRRSSLLSCPALRADWPTQHHLTEPHGEGTHPTARHSSVADQASQPPEHNHVQGWTRIGPCFSQGHRAPSLGALAASSPPWPTAPRLTHPAAPPHCAPDPRGHGGQADLQGALRVAFRHQFPQMCSPIYLRRDLLGLGRCVGPADALHPGLG